jgi:hypothetical protein
VDVDPTDETTVHAHLHKVVRLRPTISLYFFLQEPAM